jgi:hypothetical protein
MKTKDNVMQLVPKTEVSEPSAGTVMDAKIVSLDEMNSWQRPPFQRDEKLTAKVKDFAAGLKTNGGIVSGLILLGKLRGDETTIYLVDGQQRRLACNTSNEKQFYIEFCLKYYTSFVDMAEDFKRTNGRLVSFRPDDFLRAYEVTHPQLRLLHESCDFLGYSRGGSNHRGSVLTVSCALKCWFGAMQPSPAVYGQATELAEHLDEIQRQHMTTFFNTAYSAWESDRCNARLWTNLNLLMCMYLYRKLVLEPRGNPLPKDMFRKCLLSVAANAGYSEWLVGRQQYERDRDPCFKRLKRIFLARLNSEYNGKCRIQFPKPEWFVRS